MASRFVTDSSLAFLARRLRFLGYDEGSLPRTEHAARENFSLPLWPGISADVQERVVDVVRASVGAKV